MKDDSSPWLNSSDYATSFKDKHDKALERAWKNRDFEIDKYWSRATYFWTFIAATFAGFIAVNAAKDMDAGMKRDLGFMINCMGIIFSSAWVLVNAGSKQWQENWEKHIDMLEDEVTGPIYKTVLNDPSYSVSRINKFVSQFVLLIWILLAVRGLYSEFYDTTFMSSMRHYAYSVVGTSTPSFHATILVTLAVMLYWIWKMVRRGKTKTEEERGLFSFNRRTVAYDEPPPPPDPPKKPQEAEHS